MKRIMIVEDDKTIAEELLFLLNNSDYEGIILKDFENSKKEILDNNPDLILLDINIPYLNGELLLKEIRKESNIPVIMVTSKESEADEVISYSYGADDYITKPYNPTILLLKINALLKRCENNKSMIIKVTDEELLSKTGGIIQGMSGSPILQNGKLVGALTHVLVSDPTKGYGVFADIMLQQLKDAN